MHTYAIIEQNRFKLFYQHELNLYSIQALYKSTLLMLK